MAHAPRIYSFVFVVGVALFLYLPFLSKNYDLNGLAEAAAVKAGAPGDLLTPNHMLYRPAGYWVDQQLAALGRQGGVVPVLQVLSAIFGAFGIGFVYLMLKRITLNRAIAFWVSLTLAVSWSYWTLSTDVYYFSMAAMLAAATMALFVHADSRWSFFAAGLVAALAILACQANALLLPALGFVLLLREKTVHSPDWSRRAFRRLGFFWVAAIAIVGPVFIEVGTAVYQRRSLTALMHWGTSYSGGDPLPMWGAWTPDRLVSTAGSAFKSVLGMDFWMFGFFQRHLPLANGELPRWVAPLGFVLLGSVLFAAYRWGSTKRDSDNRTVFWLLILYGVYVPFIVWWEPAEPRWFILPNIYLAGLAAIVASRWANWRYFNLALPGLFLVLGGLNLATSVWPKRFVASIPTETAACVASHMKEADVFLATEWNWAGYIKYVHSRDVFNVLTDLPRNEDKRQELERVSKIVEQTRQRGGDVYMMDIKVYTPEYMKWLQEQTGLTADDLRMYTGPHAFDCVYGEFFRVDPAAHGIQ